MDGAFVKSGQERVFIRDEACERESDEMTFTIGKTKYYKEEEECHALIDVLPQFVWIIRPDGSIIYTNQRWRDYSHLLSQRAGETAWFEHQHLDDRLSIQDRQHTLLHPSPLSEKESWVQNPHPEDRERVLALQRQALATGEPYAFEYRLRDGHTGAYRWFLSRGIPQRDQAGQIIRWVSTCTDIDDQKRTEETLCQSQERVNLLMNTSMIGIFLAEGDEIMDANATFLRMTGYSQEDLQQRNVPWTTTTLPPNSSFPEQAHQEVVVQHCTTPFETELVCKDGSHLPVLMGGVAFHDQVLQGIGFVLDNSPRRELEQRKDTFLSMASHELKTPLASLKLQTQLLRKKLAKHAMPNVEVMCARMDTQLNAITRLVDELLDLSHIQAGKLEYAHEMVDLDEMLKEVVSVLQHMHLTHTIALQHAASPALVIGDRDRLVQVFLNLLSNAIKYAPDAPLIDVALHTEAEAVTISVCDQGIGIPRELQGRIFERFYWAVPPQQCAFPGLGMGLYIVSEIVKRHGGTIRVESERGKGSTFQVRFPLAARQSGRTRSIERE
jgi:PAS domain S-box-containing protein